LKAYVAPGVVDAARTAAGPNVWATTAGVEKHLFYSINDCAERTSSILIDTAANPLYKTDGANVTRDDLIVECVGNYFVYRASFALCCFYVVLALASAATATAHRGCWGPKVLAYVVGLVAVFFVPNGLFYVYGSVSRILSMVFILLQVLILVDFAFDTHDDLMGKMDATGRDDDPQPLLCCHARRSGLQCIFLSASLTLFVAGLTGVILLYALYSSSGKPDTVEDCGLNVAFTTITLLLGIVAVVVSVVEFGEAQEDASPNSIGLFVPSVVFSYCVYVTWTAALSNPESGCNPGAGSFGNDPGMTFIGMCVTAFSLGWASVRTASTVRAEFTPQKGRNASNDDERDAKDVELTDTPSTGEGNALSHGGGRKIDKKKKADEPDNALSHEEEDPSDKSDRTADPDVEEAEDGDRWHWLFHVIMAFGAVYCAMLLSDWGNGTGMSAAENFASAHTSMWVNAGGSWAAFLLFFWIRFAPVCCRGRDFEVGRAQY
jgi:hypothetical protein